MKQYKHHLHPSQQQLTVLQAMEAQKAAEARNDPVYYGTGKTDVITTQEVRELAAQGMTVPSQVQLYILHKIHLMQH